MGDPVTAPTASQRVGGQAPWSVLAKVATVVGTLGVSVVAARLLGADDFGVWSFARNLVTYLALVAAFGLDRALLRFVPELEAVGSGPGIRRLLLATLGAQALFLAVSGLILVALRPLWERLFMPEVGPLLLPVVVLTAVWVLKETLYQLYFALGRARSLAVSTTVAALAWLGFTWWLLKGGAGAAGALHAQSGALLLGLALLAPSVVRGLRALPSRTGTLVSTRRVTLYAATLVGSGFVNLIVQRQSEIFFLAAVATPAVVGFYDLGYSLPQLGMELIPLSLYAVVLAAMTSSYSRDPTRLGLLVGWYYKLLAVVTVPVAMLGLAWSDRVVELLYGAEMAPAGQLARVFSVVHLLPFVSVPIGTALAIREQAHRTLPLGLAQLGVNLGLDLLLIPRLGVTGAVLAVVLTFLLVTPLTIRFALRFTGPLEFPFRWVGRLTLALSPGFLPMLARPWLHGWVGVAAGVGASALLMLVGFRHGGLIGPEERYRLEHAHLPARRLLLALLVAGK